MMSHSQDAAAKKIEKIVVPPPQRFAVGLQWILS